jgi:saccharopine dehydrogenase-like NADP-dependent oxidoreductase
VPARAILVVGGSGAVGSRLAALLAPRWPAGVIVAARDEARVRRVARAIGGAARGARLDVDDPSAVSAALAEACLVVNCVPLRAPFHLMREAIEAGLAYTDVSPAPIWEAGLALAPLAARSGARVILGAGLAPGASSVMARALAERLGGLDAIDVTLQFHVGDEIGDAALETLIELSARTLRGVRAGQPHAFRAFDEAREIRLGEPPRARLAYRAPFTDQLWFAASLGARSAATWLALEPAWAGRMVAVLARRGMASALDKPTRRRVAIRVLQAAARPLRIRGRDFALVVEARGPQGSGRLELGGRCEPQGTAIAASLAVRALLGEQSIPPGVWFPEQVIAPAWFFPCMAALDLPVRSPGAPAPAP